MRDVDLVIEAVIDDLQVKQDLFERKHCGFTPLSEYAFNTTFI